MYGRCLCHLHMCLRNNSRPHHNHPSQATSSHHITSHPIPFFPGTFCVLFTYQPPRTAQPYQTLRAPIPTAGQRSHVPKTIHISPPENPKKTPTYVMLCSGSNNPYMPARPVMSAACGVFICAPVTFPLQQRRQARKKHRYYLL